MVSTSIIAYLVAKERHLRISGEIILGRHRSNTIVINDPAASRQHSKVSLENEVVWLEDLGSANGTRLNGRIVREKTRLKHGDTIAIGAFSLGVLIESDAEESNAHLAPVEAEDSSDQPQVKATRIEDLVGSSLGKIHLKTVIDRDAFSVLMHGQDRSLAREIAIRIFRPEAIKKMPKFPERVRLLISRIGSLQHPALSRIDEFSEENGLVWIAMEWVRGTTLEGLIRRSGPLPLAATCMILERSARALDEAHQKALFHGGLAPVHMALDEAGSVKVLNLGLYQAVAEAFEGTNIYLPDARYQDPRRMSGCLDATGDIYALGCVFHFLLTAKPPWTADSPEALTKLHREAPLPLLSERFPEHGSAIDKILTGCLAKNPEWRYRRAQELADELKALREKLSEQQASESFEEIGRRVKKSHRPKQRGKEWGTEEATHLELGKSVSDHSFRGLLRLTLFAACLIVVAVLAWRFLPREGNMAGNGTGRTHAFTKASDLEIFTTKDGTIDFGSSGIEGPGPFAHLVSQPLVDGKEWTLEWTLDLAETTLCSIAVIETGHSVLLVNLSRQKLNLSLRPPGGTSDVFDVSPQVPWSQPITLRLEGSPSKTTVVVNGQPYAPAATLSGLNRASIDISFAGGFWRLSRMEVR